MGDSLLVIEWMKRVKNLENINLRPIFEEAQNYSKSIPSVNYVRVNMERNKLASQLSKYGLQVGLGS